MFISTLLRLCLSAVERGGAPGREGIQDGRPGRLPACGVRPDEAVLDPGRRGAALLPHAEGEAAAYQSQGALPVKGRPRGAKGGEEGGGTQRSTAVRWEEEEKKTKRDHSTFLLPAQPVDLWDCHTVPPPLTSDVRQPPSASIQGLFSCLCCIAFARQFPLLSMGHCSFLLLYLPLLTCSLCLFSLGPSFSSSSTWKTPLLFCIFSSPPPLLNMALTGGEAGLFLHVCQVLFLLPSDPPSFLDLCITVWLCMNSAQLSVIPSFLPSILPSLPSAWCQVWGLRSVPKCLQSTELQTSLQHFFQLDCCGLIFFFFLIPFFKKSFLLLSFFFREVIKPLF